MVSQLTWLRGLRSLIDEYRAELEFTETGIASTNTSATDHISHTKNFLLALADESLVLAFIVRAKLPLFIFQLDELLKLGVSSIVGDLLMKRQERDGRIKSFARLGCEADHLEAGGVDLFRELINGNVGGGANENLARIHLRQMIHDRCRGNRLSCTRRSLDKAKRFLQHTFHRIHLGMV